MTMLRDLIKNNYWDLGSIYQKRKKKSNKMYGYSLYQLKIMTNIIKITFNLIQHS